MICNQPATISLLKRGSLSNPTKSQLWEVEFNRDTSIKSIKPINEKYIVKEVD